MRDGMRRLLLLLPLACAACSSAPLTFRQVGTLAPGSQIVVRNRDGEIDAYAPKIGQPKDTYTIEAFGAKGSAPTLLRRTGGTIVVRPAETLDGSARGRAVVRYLVRAPAGVTLHLSTERGRINVANAKGTVDARTRRGDIKIMVSGYANARADAGNVSVTFGSTDWPGTLHFSTDTGNVTIWVNATVSAHVHLHTDRGTIFTDFPLRGTSKGSNETIDGWIGGPANRGIDVEVHDGSIRMLQLKRQV